MSKAQSPKSFLRFFQHQMRSLRQDQALKRNIILLLISNLVTSAIAFFYAIALANLLSREAYGTIKYVDRMVRLVLVFSAPGITNAITYSVARGFEGEFRRGSIHRLRACRRNTLLLLVPAGWYGFIDRDIELALMIVASMVLVPWMHGLDTGEPYLVGRSDFSTLFWRRLAVTMGITGSGVAAALFIPAAYAVYIGRAAVGAILIIAVYRWLLRSTQNDEEDPLFWSRAKDFNIISALSALGGTIDGFLLGALGAVSQLAAYSLTTSVMAPLDILSKSGLKLVYNRMVQPKTLTSRRMWVMLSLVFIVAGIPAMLLLWYLVGFRVILIALPKYPELVVYVPMLFVAFVFGFADILPASYSLFHRYKLWARYNSARNASRIFAAVIAVLLSGVWGALCVRVVYTITDYLVYAIAMWRADETG